MRRKAIRRGTLFYADLDPVVGSEQGGTRPVLVLQNNVGNSFSPTVVTAAITSRRDKTNLPTHVSLENVVYVLLFIRHVMHRNQLCVAPPKKAEKQGFQALFL